MAKLDVLFLLLTVWSTKCVALNCYQCDSNTEADCQEFFDHAHQNSLTIKPTQCSVDASKFCIKTTGVWGGIVGTRRFCSSRDMFNQCQYVQYPDHNRIYRACIYTCNTDECNGASRQQSYISLVPILILLLRFLLH